MKCPQCGSLIQRSWTVCLTCGCDVAMLSSLETLRESLRLMRGQTEAMSRRLRELEDAADALQPMMIERLTPPPPQEPEQKPKPEPVEADSLHDTQRLGEPIAAMAETTVSDETPPLATPIPPPHKWTIDDSMLDTSVELRLGQKWLLITGIVSTILAIGYFLKYSFDRNWIGPAGRVGLAYLAGGLLLGTGEFFRRRKFDVFGLYLIGGGLGVMYFASYAAFQIYHLVGQPIAFGLMVVVTVLAGALSVFYDTKWLAVLGIIGGYLTPVVLSTHVDNQIALMTYMVILSGGILGIAAFKRWYTLNYLGLLFTWLLFAAWYDRYYSVSRFWVTTWYLNTFFLIYTLVPFVFYFVRRGQQAVTGFGLTIPNTLIAFGYSYAMIRGAYSNEAVSELTLIYAAIFFALAWYLRRTNRANVDAFALLLAKGVLFLAVTVPLLFSSHWITIFWAIQGVVVLWAGIRIADYRVGACGVVLVAIAVMRLVLHDYPSEFGFALANVSFGGAFWTTAYARWVTIGSVLACLFLAGRIVRRVDGPSFFLPAGLASGFFAFFGVLLFAALNIEVSGYMVEVLPGARFAAISVLWGVFAAALMVLGFARRAVVLRHCSITLFAATVVKVLVNDMANVSTPYRILSFLVIGLLLVAMSFLYHRYASRILGPAEAPTT